MIVMKNYALKNKIILAIISILFASPVWAVSTEAPDKNWYMDDVTFWILIAVAAILFYVIYACLLYTSPSPRDRTRSRMPSSA